MKKNTEALIVASKETGLEVNVYKTWYMIMSRVHNAGKIYNIKNDKETRERVEHFIYL